MDEPNTTVALPEKYRPKPSASDLSRRVRGLDPSQRGFTVPEAIRIDRGWGVWLDLNAPVKFVGPNAPPPRGYPILITVHHIGPDGRLGYSVDLEFAKAAGQVWTPSPMESFGVEGLRQFVPVFKVC
jgi:hypothetical protein